MRGGNWVVCGEGLMGGSMGGGCGVVELSIVGCKGELLSECLLVRRG